jgi:photosystem II stability/assembly factor-like uncharacterized protein/lysophospholipase L1-like esterase
MHYSTLTPPLISHNHKRRSAVAMAALLLTLSSLTGIPTTSAARAANLLDTAWQAAGLDGGYAGLIVTDRHSPGRLYVTHGTSGVGRALFRSDDNGQSWGFRSFIPTLGDAGAILTGPAGDLFVLDAEAHISTDGGVSWETRGSLPSFVRDAVFSKDAIVAISGEGSACVISRSADQGRAWTQVRSDAPCGRLASAPSDPDVIYLGSVDRSRDGGRTWTQLAPSGAPNVSQVTVSWADSNSLFAVDYVSGPLLYHSADGGETWEVPRMIQVPGFQNSSEALATGPTGCLVIPGYQHPNSQQFDLAVAGTCDAGNSWSTATDVVGDRWGLSAESPIQASSNSGVYFAGVAPSGILKSTDSGRTWSLSNKGLFAAPVGRMLSSVQTAEKALFALDEPWTQSEPAQQYGPVFRADASGFVEGGPLGNPGTVLGLSKGANGAVFAATTASGINPSHTVWRSDDNGTNWRAADQGLPHGESGYPAAKAAYGISFDSAGQHGLVVSVRSTYSEPDHHCLASEHQRDQYTCQGIFRTSDGGNSWSPAAGGLMETALDFADILIDPTDGSFAVLMAQPGYTFTSSDGGQNWRPAAEGWPVRTFFQTDGTMLGLGPSDLLTSRDHGASWEVLSPAGTFPGITSIRTDRLQSALASDPVTGSIWIANLNGVYERNPQDGNWNLLEANWPKRNGYSLMPSGIMFDPADGVLYAATEELGLWKMHSGVVKDIEPPGVEILSISRRPSNAPFHVTLTVRADDHGTGDSPITKIHWRWSVAGKGLAGPHTEVIIPPLTSAGIFTFDIPVTEADPEPETASCRLKFQLRLGPRSCTKINQLLVQAEDAASNISVQDSKDWRSPKSPVYVALGDSFASGYHGFSAIRNDPNYGYPAYLKEMLPKSGQWKYLYINEAKSGATTAQVKDNQLPSALGQLRNHPDSWNVVTLTAGGNDTAFEESVRGWYLQNSSCPREAPIVKPSSIVTNDRFILEKLRDADSNAFLASTGYPNPFTTLHPCFDVAASFAQELNGQVNEATRPINRARFVDYYDEFAKAPPVTHDSPYFPFLSGASHPYIQNSVAGFPHPNKEGHRHIAAAVFRLRPWH